jgi:hypothetical protein
MVNAVTYILENDPTVQSLVGGNSRSSKHKVFPVITPMSEVEPYIVVRLLSKTPLGNGCGFLYNIAVISYHTSYDDVTVLNRAIIDAIVGYPSGIVNGVDYGRLTFASESDEPFSVDRIAITHEHPLYIKATTFTGMGDDGISS